jgi:hypothetical protein
MGVAGSVIRIEGGLLYLLAGGLKPYDMESDIETATALTKTMEVSNHTIWNPI